MPSNEDYQTSQMHCQIEKNFTYHKPNESQVERMVDLRMQAKNTAHWIAANCPPSRETSLALTKLEEAVMHANSAIVRNE